MLGWRDVPHDVDAVGWRARESKPRMRQLFVGARGAQEADRDAFERKLYVIRRLAEKRIVETFGGAAFSPFRASPRGPLSTRGC